jgi:hypothetical protein
MLKLKIADLVGEHCVTSEDGRKVYERIVPKIQSNEKVSLDFDGVSVFASPFFNFAVGQLLKDFSPDKLNKLLSVDNLSPDGSSVWKRVVQNAKEYYRNPRAKEAFDTTIEEETEEA